MYERYSLKLMETANKTCKYYTSEHAKSRMSTPIKIRYLERKLLESPVIHTVKQKVNTYKEMCASLEIVLISTITIMYTINYNGEN